MRGALDLWAMMVSIVGIIPADAGSTSLYILRLQQFGDHPRGCGEHQMGAMRRLSPPGSSPRMRGAPRLGLASRPVEGIIPADAGSTLSYTFALDPQQDHPRGCGEHLS